MLLQIQKIMPDGGSYYAETNPAYWLVEPYNAISSLAFFFPILYYSYLLSGKYVQYLTITLALPLLFLNGLGSTLFHAFRNNTVWLVMDFAPVLVLMLGLSADFWGKILGGIGRGVCAVLVFIGLHIVAHYLFPPSMGINIGYFLRGTMLFLPMVLMLQKRNYKNAGWLIFGVLFFILALVFRGLDKRVTHILFMGSHFLWHISTVIGVFLICEYVYRERKEELQLSNAQRGNF